MDEKYEGYQDPKRFWSFSTPPIPGLPAVNCNNYVAFAAIFRHFAVPNRSLRISAQRPVQSRTSGSFGLEILAR